VAKTKKKKKKRKNRRGRGETHRKDMSERETTQSDGSSDVDDVLFGSDEEDWYTAALVAKQRRKETERAEKGWRERSARDADRLRQGGGSGFVELGHVDPRETGRRRSSINVVHSGSLSSPNTAMDEADSAHELGHWLKQQEREARKERLLRQLRVFCFCLSFCPCSRASKDEVDQDDDSATPGGRFPGSAADGEYEEAGL